MASDRYGAGEVIEGFERKIAALLGKPAAVFMPTGTMAQQVALRIWSDRAPNRRIGYHATSHLELHEYKAHALLHGLIGIHVGSPHEIITPDHVEEALQEPLAALLYELPQREIGGPLPSWDQLQEIAANCRKRGTRLHMDGARLWESQPHFGKSYAEINSVFDSVYVSFYKGIGGLAGAVLAGPEDFVAEARVWMRRHGGNLITLFPYVLSAIQNFDRRLPRMEAYCKAAQKVAEELKRIPGIQLTPDPPVTNMFHIFIPGDRAVLEAASLEIARTEKIQLFRKLAPTVLPRLHRYEFAAGDHTLQFPMHRIPELFWRVLKAR